MKPNLALKGIVAALGYMKRGNTKMAASYLDAVVASAHFPQAYSALKAVAEEVAVPDDSFDPELDAVQTGEELREELEAAAKARVTRAAKAAKVSAADADHLKEFQFKSEDDEDSDDSDDDDDDDEDVTAARKRRFQANVRHGNLLRRLSASKAKG